MAWEEPEKRLQWSYFKTVEVQQGSLISVEVKLIHHSEVWLSHPSIIIHLSTWHVTSNTGCWQWCKQKHNLTVLPVTSWYFHDCISTLHARDVWNFRAECFSPKWAKYVFSSTPWGIRISVVNVCTVTAPSTPTLHFTFALPRVLVIEIEFYGQ